MLQLLRELDRILRGEATRPDRIVEEGIRIPIGGITVVLIGLGAIYGLCMGSFTIANRDPFELRLVIAPILKVPLLYFLTLIVTFPSLYVFNALVGSRLRLVEMLRLIIAALAVTLAVLASFGPIIAFFSFSTKTYPFMIVLNVVAFAVAGVLGLTFLLRTLYRLTAANSPGPLPVEPQADGENGPSALERLGPPPQRGGARTVFNIWVLIFGLVGAQMAWVLRPFIGAPDLEFAWFRLRESNFFEAFFRHLSHLLGGS